MLAGILPELGMDLVLQFELPSWSRAAARAAVLQVICKTVFTQLP
jgi:hypothetical protein